MKAASLLITTFEFSRLAKMVVRFYQIRDDYMNLNSIDYHKQKGFCEDLDEGKFSYPVVHCIQHSTRCRNHILGIFRQRLIAPKEPLSLECEEHILEYLEETQTTEVAWLLLEELEVKIEKEIGELETSTGESNPMLHPVFKRLSVRADKKLPPKKINATVNWDHLYKLYIFVDS